MQALTINLNLITDVKDFINVVGSIDCDVDIVRGRYVIDAKSIMGIFTLDLSEPLDLMIHSNDESILKNFDKWVVE